uniref:Polysaccharide biosynthesis domain-containing protein n=1 Tax=Strigamia maritima TaxID=126957 RepID=T1IIT6_STRMM
MAEFFDKDALNSVQEDIFSKPADEFGNDASIEALWAMKAYKHAEIYFNLLCSIDVQHLKLTPHDDKIYEEFRKVFPDIEVGLLTEAALKNAEAKEIWRPFCNNFQHIEDFNFATLLRLNPELDYSEENSILVPRIQFYAIEIARNREGKNTLLRQPNKHKTT